MINNELYKSQLRDHYVRITVLDSNTQIEGLVTSGSINVNGNSALRRSGSLSCVVDKKILNPNITDIDNLISIKTKIKIEIGLAAPDTEITWFKLGQFVVSGANIQHNLQNITMSINFKDKMALLNGELGGVFSRSMVHTPIYDYSGNSNQPVKTPVTFRALIKALVKEYSGLTDDQIHIKLSEKETGNYSEEWDKIDQIVSWTGNNSLYIYTNKGEYAFSSTRPPEGHYDSGSLNEIVYGDAIGYQRIPFTYPVEKELTSNTGESVVSVLDKIKATLGNFEYFFDIDGEFYFQPIANFQNKGIESDKLEEAINEYKEKGCFNYNVPGGNKALATLDLSDLTLVTAFNNSPKYESIKNDLSVTGVRGDNKQVIQYHLVFEDKSKSPLQIPTNTKFSIYTDSLGISRFKVDSQGKSISNISSLDYRTQMYLGYLALENGDQLINYPQWRIWGKELKEWWPYVMTFTCSQSGVVTEVFSALESLPSSLHNLNYYFEMIDMSQYGLNVSQIGHRPKSMNNDKVNVVFQTEPIPVYCVIAGRGDETARDRKEAINAESNGIGFMQIPAAYGNTMAQGLAQNSAYDNIRSMVHTTIQYNESVSITTIPIYDLQPNTLILAMDEDAGVNEPTLYEVKSFSIPLTHNGTMTLSCVRATTMI